MARVRKKRVGNFGLPDLVPSARDFLVFKTSPAGGVKRKRESKEFWLILGKKTDVIWRSLP